MITHANRSTAELREQITAARPVEFLIKVAGGRKIRVGPQGRPGGPTYAYPSLEQRLRAAELLMRKILPDLTSAEITGAAGARSGRHSRRSTTSDYIGVWQTLIEPWCEADAERTLL
jgi:hypothetical protein